ncbi:lipoprotein signal peptidase [Litorimonas cladophorae]|uniref:Lipoprotein signal peptidase n=2 Tax=Litorimonas cladophorae TaxID=1220491 RepID=A0A918NE67_9PROT|nr:lipoprotein signal peptidase [Litorimonas cladophorae]
MLSRVSSGMGANMTNLAENPQSTATDKPLGWAGFALLGGAIPAVLVALDQLSKWATTRFFDLPMSICSTADPRLTHEVSPIADLSLLCNRGISWGLLQGDSSVKRWALTVFAFLMTLALLYVLRKTKDRLGQFSLCLVIAGAVGNAIDRLFFGAVTDMIDFSDIGFKFVFNVADSYITIGVIGLFVSSFINDRREKAANSPKSED